MRRRFPQHKEPDCPAMILFRYSDRQTIRIFDASGEDNYTVYFCKEPLSALGPEITVAYASRVYSFCNVDAPVHKTEYTRDAYAKVVSRPSRTEC